MFANIKILESLFIKNPREAEEYLAYSKFQTKAILALNQNYRATKAQDSWGSNLDDLSAQYFDAAVVQRPSRALHIRGDRRGSTGATGEEFCFRWNFNPNGCPNPQSCRYKHLCIHCSSDKHKGKSCTGSTSSRPAKNERFWNWNRPRLRSLHLLFPRLRIARSISTLGRRNSLLTRIELLFSMVCVTVLNISRVRPLLSRRLRLRKLFKC